ncbi:MAG: hypothetical protein M1150_04240 [Patescibacteria group bacterium]|nr:hypothetical protein [Patescibacteria group bacterium]
MKKLFIAWRRRLFGLTVGVLVLVGGAVALNVSSYLLMSVLDASQYSSQLIATFDKDFNDVFSVLLPVLSGYLAVRIIKQKPIFYSFLVGLIPMVLILIFIGLSYTLLKSTPFGPAYPTLSTTEIIQYQVVPVLISSVFTVLETTLGGMIAKQTVSKEKA